MERAGRRQGDHVSGDDLWRPWEKSLLWSDSHCISRMRQLLGTARDIKTC